MAAPALAQTNAPAGYAGTWDYTIVTPDGEQTGVLELTDTGGTLTLADGRTVGLVGLKADGDRLSFGLADAAVAQGVRVALYGDVFKGRMTVPGKGSPEIRGVRRGPDGKPAFVLGKINTNLSVRELLGNEAARAVIDRHIPGFSSRPNLQQGMDYPFRTVVTYLDIAPEKVLYAIDADLSKL